MPNTYEIPYSKLETILKRRQRVAKRNAASGLPVPVVEVTGRSSREIEVRDALARMRGAASDARMIRVATVIIEVDGFTARYGDWDVTGYRWGGMRRTASGDVPYVGSSPEVPRSIAARDTLECDHCQAIRKRTSSYVVERVDGTGEPFEVGATCMSAFLGTPANDGVLAGLADNAMLLEEISRLAASNFLESQDDIFDEIDTVMAVAVSVIAREGFVSAREATPGYPATWATVYEEVRRYRAPDLDDGDVAVNISDFMQAGLVVQWLREAAKEADASAFIRKAGEVLDTGISSPQDVAILTALVGSHGRHLEQQERLAREKNVARGSRHVGVIGARSNFVCSVQAIRPYQGRFGPASVVELVDAGGNLLLWFASGARHGLQTGRTYEIAGTVKEHEIAVRGGYRGAEQTLLNRVKIVQDFGETMAAREDNAAERQESREFDELIGYLAPPRM
ncbi:hypothetical protein OIU34_17805 [Pararhizobium sp. BT-229]|uniref:hypothetical protein n=1 Tax=Pararhizobium sp. BT-229 TaxID=2986923 RepID=UPI0021F78704|nr:hypothetical protein [Pararhizobium sp. BT-229]MCV9963733.1 hypothetical protein [Pararhizobium sp. BT-229]